MKHNITVCMGSSCFARGNEKNIRIIQAFLKEHGLEEEVELAGARCEGICAKGPNILIDGEIYDRIGPDALRDVLERKILGKNS